VAFVLTFAAVSYKNREKAKATIHQVKRGFSTKLNNIFYAHKITEVVYKSQLIFIFFYHKKSVAIKSHS
jgi:hypothetical protein